MIGSRQWMNLSQGNLSSKEKLQLIQHIIMPVSLGYAQRWFKRPHHNTQLHLDQISLPDTRVIQEATEILAHCGSPAIIYHSWRCFFWAIAIAQSKSWQFDMESLLIASLMHDLGLVDSTPSQSCYCFSYLSALKAEQLCQQHAFPVQRTENISNAICLHMNGYLNQENPQLSKEVLLLQCATSCDVTAIDLASIPLTYQKQVLEKYPRENFNQVFNILTKQEAQRCPQSRTALLRQLGLSLMIKSNGFE